MISCVQRLKNLKKYLRDMAHSSTRPRLIKHERRKTLLVRLVFVLRGTMHSGLRFFLKQHSYFQCPTFDETYLSLLVPSQIPSMNVSKVTFENVSLQPIT